MSVNVRGQFTRVRWRAFDEVVRQVLAGPAVTALELAALLDQADVSWGLSPDQWVLMRGTDADVPNEGALVRVPAEPPASNGPSKMPATGTWLICVEHSAHPWAAMQAVDTAMSEADLGFAWHALDVPGARRIVLAQPCCGTVAFDLMWPPAYHPDVQALLDRDGKTLRTAPFERERGQDDPEAKSALSDDASRERKDLLQHPWRWSRCKFRFGLLHDGAMQWLDVPRGRRAVPSLPGTSLFRTRLSLLSRELEARGIHYADDEDGLNYELHFALEDSATPADFHEPHAPFARSVSSYHDLDEKRDRADTKWDPDGSVELYKYDIHYAGMDSRTEVTATPLICLEGEIAGQAVTEAWVLDTIAEAATAAGLMADAPDRGRLVTEVSLSEKGRAGVDVTTQSLPEWNAVDATDRVQRAAYLIVTGGVADPAVEAWLAQLRGTIVACLLPDAPAGAQRVDRKGPFPRRAPAIIAFGNTLNDLSQRAVTMETVLASVVRSDERALAMMIADHAGGGDPATRSLAERLWGPLATREGQAAWLRSLPEMSPMDQPRSPPDVADLIDAGSAEAFALAWRAIDASQRADIGLSLLLAALRAGRLDRATLLLDDGIPINGVSDRDAEERDGVLLAPTPLSAAIAGGSLAAFRFCQERGADLARATEARCWFAGQGVAQWDVPALIVAAEHGQPALLADLLASGTPADLMLPDGTHLLGAAARGGCSACVRQVLAVGADALRQDAAGRTALDIARIAVDSDSEAPAQDAVIKLLLAAERTACAFTR